MIRIEGDILIDRPVEEVFDVVADERNEPRYNPRIRRVHKLTPGPIGHGTRFRAETTAMGRTAGIAIQYTAYQRPRRLASSIHMAAADIQGTLTFDPVADSTRMGWSWELRLRGWYRLLAPVIARSGRRQEQDTWAALKQFLERRHDDAFRAKVRSREAWCAGPGRRRLRPGGRPPAWTGCWTRSS